MHDCVKVTLFAFTSVESWLTDLCFLKNLPIFLQLVSFQEAKLLLNEDDYLLKSVYDYWVRKRKNCRGPSLIPQVKQEKRDGSTNNDPYVAFRRRTEKMQTRKVRESCYPKITLSSFHDPLPVIHSSYCSLPARIVRMMRPHMRRC